MAKKTLEEWEKEFFILCAGKGTFINSGEFVQGISEVKRKIEAFMTPCKGRGVTGTTLFTNMMTVREFSETSLPEN